MGYNEVQNIPIHTCTPLHKDGLQRGIKHSRRMFIPAIILLFILLIIPPLFPTFYSNYYFTSILLKFIFVTPVTNKGYHFPPIILHQTCPSDLWKITVNLLLVK